MNIGLWYISIVSWIQRNSVWLDVVCTRLVGEILWVVETSWLRWSFTRSITEICILVHVKPNTRKLNLLIENLEHILPVLGSVWMEKINKSSCSWPNHALEFLFSSSILHKNSSFFSLFIGYSIIYFNASIHDRYIMISACDFFHLVKREFFFIHCKIFIFNHIVNVRPNSIKRNRMIFVGFQYIL